EWTYSRNGCNIIILNLITERVDEAVKKVLVLLLLVVVGVAVYAVVTDTQEEGQTNEIEKNNEQKEENKTDGELEPNSVDPIAENMEEMTLDEKIGQLFISGMEGTEMTDETAAMIEEITIGGVIMIETNEEEIYRSLLLEIELKQLEEANYLPIFISVYQEGVQMDCLTGLPPLKSAGEIGQ